VSHAAIASHAIQSTFVLRAEIAFGAATSTGAKNPLLLLRRIGDNIHMTTERTLLLPTIENLLGKHDRDVRSTCCEARVNVVYTSISSAAGRQLVCACNRCSKIFVALTEGPRG
jgi:hypothetical protein